MEGFSIPLGEWVNSWFDRYMNSISNVTRHISKGLEKVVGLIENILLFIPPIIFIIVIGILIWFITKSKKLTAFLVLGFIFIIGVDLWKESMSTLALVLSGTAVALAIGIPIGILAALNNRFDSILRPILDLMQTLPSFVYLIPAVMFFGLGNIAALSAILIFAMPPAIRLTNLGIRQVPEDKIEAARSFGSNKKQILLWVQLPLARKTIMAGVNQCIMMALSMSVIAAMIGAGGLGRGVLKAMQTVNIGMGIEGGICIVILAILLDRMTEHFANGSTSIE